MGYEDGSWSHPLGTDELGRDVLSRLMGGARTTVLIGLAGVLLAGAVGTVLGIVQSGVRRPERGSILNNFSAHADRERRGARSKSEGWCRKGLGKARL